MEIFTGYGPIHGCIIVRFVTLLKEHVPMADPQVMHFPKLSRNGHFRPCPGQLHALLTTPDRNDRFVSEDPTNDVEALLNRKAKA
jgi:hypothetical protein